VIAYANSLARPGRKDALKMPVSYGAVAAVDVWEMQAAAIMPKLFLRAGT